MMHQFSTLGRRKNSPNKWRTSSNSSGGTTGGAPTAVSGVSGQQGLADNKFMGEGQTFKGKLIGVLEVQEARGDRMCQDALIELKTAIRASGEHKQRVVIHVAVDGLKIRDEKSGDCLYHHPVHKISFIAQDVADNRAFGYIYGSPENGHRFFGIKTEKAAGQVVVAMRDLFQVVFELKKKEIEDAKTMLENKEQQQQVQKSKENLLLPPHHPSNVGASNQQHSAASFPDGNPLQPPPVQQQKVHGSVGGATTGGASGALNDLLGLESECANIQAGIRQIDQIGSNPVALAALQNQQQGMGYNTPEMIPIGSLQPSSNQFPGANQMNVTQPVASAPQQGQKPHYPHAIMNSGGVTSKQDLFGATPFLPPPPSKNSAPRQQQQPMQQQQPNPQQQFPQQQQLIQNNAANASSDQLQGLVLQETDRYAGLSGFDSIPPPATSVSAAQKQNQLTNPTTGIIGNANFDTNFNSINTNNFSNNSGHGQPAANVMDGMANAFGQSNQQFGNTSQGESMVPQRQQVPLTASSQHINTATANTSGGLAGLFTDLDPLGSGKSKPYLDKKDFFSAEKMATSPKLTGRKASNAGLNATLPSPSATGATPFSGTSNAAAPGSTNSPVPSLDALTNSLPLIIEPAPAIAAPNMEQSATPQDALADFLS